MGKRIGRLLLVVLGLLALLALGTGAAAGLGWMMVPYREMPRRDVVEMQEEQPKLSAVLRALTILKTNTPGAALHTLPEGATAQNLVLSGWKAAPGRADLYLHEEAGVALLLSRDRQGRVCRVTLSLDEVTEGATRDGRLRVPFPSGQPIKVGDPSKGERALLIERRGEGITRLEFTPHGPRRFRAVLHIISPNDPRFRTRFDTHGLAPGDPMLEHIQKAIAEEAARLGRRPLRSTPQAPSP